MALAVLGSAITHASWAQDDPVDRPAKPRAIASFSGEPVPGQVITLTAEAAKSARLSYRWEQLGGVAVALDHPNARRASFRVPTTDEPLRFQLVAGDASGVESTEIAITPRLPESTASRSTPRADAGDDQVGLTGHLITLNGSRSQPARNLGFRWIQLAGPAAATARQEGPYCSFTPRAAGIYRFALLVAVGSTISEPDTIDVYVGPANAGGAAASNANAGPAPNARDGQVAAARSLLSSVDGGAALGEPLAGVFDAVASRMDFYRTYSDLFSEMSRRLAALIPEDPARRAQWVERVFNPLTNGMVAKMRGLGLDLVRPDGPATPMSAAQKLSLAEFFKSTAEGFRLAGAGK